MFDALSEKLGGVLRSLRGRGRITEDNVREAMREVRTALLEADVHVEVARKFCDDVPRRRPSAARSSRPCSPSRSWSRSSTTSWSASWARSRPRIPFVSQPPTVILMAGLQGSGKTTTCGKLARYCMQQRQEAAAGRGRPEAPGGHRPARGPRRAGRRPGLRRARPPEPGQGLPQRASASSRKHDRDVVILDTAGRLAIDEELMNEVAQIAADHPAAPDLPRARRHDRPGRGQHRQGASTSGWSSTA